MLRRKILYPFLISTGFSLIVGEAKSATLDILLPTEGQKITLPSIGVKGNGNPTTAFAGQIQWETTIEGKKHTVVTSLGVLGSISVPNADFPSSNSFFGPNTVTATAELETIPPTVSITQPTAGQSFFVGQTMTIAGTAHDGETGIENIGIVIQGQAGVITPNTNPVLPVISSTTVGWSSVNVPVPSAPGTYTISVSAKDKAGNTASEQVQIDVQPDTTPPQVSITQPASNVIQGSLVTISGTASDGESGLKSILLQVNGALIPVGIYLPGLPSSPGATVPFAAVIKAPAQANQPIDIVAKAEDNAGNETSATKTIQTLADTTPPEQL